MAGISNFSSLRPPCARIPSARVGEMLDQGVVSSNKVPQPRAILTGPVAILWDIENCPVPGEVNAEDVAGNIRMALRVHPAVKGAVTMFSAYGDFNHFPRRLREGCQRTGVNLIDVPNGKKDASDKAILVDMFLFALDNPPPCTILLISGDVDFAPALHKLGQRGYTMVLAIPAGVGVSSALCNAGRFVWDWPSVARGEGLVPAKAFLNRSGEDRMTEFSAYMMGSAWHSSDDSDLPTEDERHVYQTHASTNCFLSGHAGATQVSVTTGLTHGGSFPFDFSRLAVSQGSMHSSMINSQSSPVAQSYQTNQTCASAVASSSCGKVLLNSTSAYSHILQKQGDISLNAETGSAEPWVQPGDLQGLKGQFVRLVKLNGGKLPLLRIPSEYCKLFGRPLYLSEYGSPKLVHLIERMPEAFFIKGVGNKRILHLKESMRAQPKHRRARVNISLHVNDRRDMGEFESHMENTAKVLGQVLKDGEDFMEDIVLLQPHPEMCSDDEKASEVDEEDDEEPKVFQCAEEEQEEDEEEEEASDRQEYMTEVRLEVFRQELQELLVSHACKIPLLSLQTLYKQRYACELDVASFGVEELELLLEKMQDVAAVKMDKATSRKFLIAKHIA